MTVRAEVAAVDLPIEAVLALRPGDVLKLDARADEGVTLYAGAVPVHRALPGRSGGRRAIQITAPLGGLQK
jgi:flagellar motor switch protein FliM